MPGLARVNSQRTRAITGKVLRSWPIVQPESDDSKEERGRVLVVGGDREIPGAVLLAGMAALRGGAGKLQLGTCASAAVHIGIALPEARVIALEETSKGCIRGKAFHQIREPMSRSHATLIGPGMTSERECGAFLRDIISHPGTGALVLDAGMLTPFHTMIPSWTPLSMRAAVTPHAGEMAAILNEDIRTVLDNPADCARQVAETLGVVVALKGAETHIVSPDGEHFVYRGGSVGLATSGSGDILAGLIAGLGARTEDLLQAVVWGVFVHGAAGNAIARKNGLVGYLARELLSVIPRTLNALSAPP